jgi:hypothetical protein
MDRRKLHHTFNVGFPVRGDRPRPLRQFDCMQSKGQPPRARGWNSLVGSRKPDFPIRSILPIFLFVAAGLDAEPMRIAGHITPKMSERSQIKISVSFTTAVP